MADSVRLQSTYIRRTPGCRRRKQDRPRSESFPSLVLIRAVHNRSRQWATLNYSGSSSANTTALTLDWKSWNKKTERPKILTCTSAHAWIFVNLNLWVLLKSKTYFCLGICFVYHKMPFCSFQDLHHGPALSITDPYLKKTLQKSFKQYENRNKCSSRW